MVACSGARAPGRRSSRHTWTFCVKNSSHLQRPRLRSGQAVPHVRSSSAFRTFLRLASRLPTMPLSKPWRRLRCQMLMPTCIPGSSRRSRREPPSASNGCRCGARSCVTKVHRKSWQFGSNAFVPRCSRGCCWCTGRSFQPFLKRSVSQLLVALDILTDFESWGRMREGHGLSIEAARDIWINAIGRMLPAVALDPARSNPPSV